MTDGNGAGRGGAKGWVFVLALHGFVLSHPCPAPHDGKNFLTSSLPFAAPRSTAPPRKTVLFVNLPYN